MTQAETNLHGMVVDELVWPFEPPAKPGHSRQEVVTAFWQDGTPMRVLFSGAVPHNDRPQ